MSRKRDKRASESNQKLADESEERIIIKKQKRNTELCRFQNDGDEKKENENTGETIKSLDANEAETDIGVHHKTIFSEKELSVDWPPGDLQMLFTRMEAYIPENDSMAFSVRIEKLNWKKIAFKNYSPAECQNTWYLVQERIRNFRVLSEILEDARRLTSILCTSFYTGSKTTPHPAMPQHLLSNYTLLCMQKKDKVTVENAEIVTSDVPKSVSQFYKGIPKVEREKYGKVALEKRKKCKEQLKQNQLDQFHLESEKSKPLSKSGPKKPSTPFILFYEEQLKKAGENISRSKFKKQCKMLWKNMSDKKVTWINKATEEEAKYNEEIRNYAYQHPSFVIRPLRSVLTREERLIKERVAGKPLKPPSSAYGLYSKMLLQSEEIKNVNAKDRLNYVSSQWKVCSKEKKEEYKERAKQLNEQYKIDFAVYLETLPKDKRQEELKNRMPKKMTKGKQQQQQQQQPQETKRTPKVNKNKNEVDVEENIKTFFKGEPKQPPLTAIELYKDTYTGKKPIRQAWKGLSEQERKNYASQVKKLKLKYIAEFEVFLKNLTKEEIKAYKRHRRDVEQQAAIKDKESSYSDSSEYEDTDTSDATM